MSGNASGVITLDNRMQGGGGCQPPQTILSHGMLYLWDGVRRHA